MINVEDTKILELEKGDEKNLKILMIFKEKDEFIKV